MAKNDRLGRLAWLGFVAAVILFGVLVLGLAMFFASINSTS